MFPSTTSDGKVLALLELLFAMASRICSVGDRAFEITVAETSPGRWTVEHVYNGSLNQEIQVPGMDQVVATTEDAAFASACDCINESHRSKLSATK